MLIKLCCCIALTSLIACTTERTIVTNYDCLNTFPYDAYGVYQLKWTHIRNTADNSSDARWTPNTSGTLKFKDDDFLYMEIDGEVVQGTFEVETGIIMVYTSPPDNLDILLAIQYQYANGKITLNFYDKSTNCRHTSFWSKPMTWNSEYDD